jgi:hypothetical protein
VPLVQKINLRRKPGGNLKSIQRFGWETLRMGDTGVGERRISECGL